MTLTIDKLDVRPVAAADNAALAKFMHSFADGGRFKFQVLPRTEDVISAFGVRNPGSFGLAAYLPGATDMVATIWAAPVPNLVYAGQQGLTGVLLNSLAVHPDYRGRGIGAELIAKIISFAQSELAGQNLVFYGYIQKGNLASQAVCQKAGGILSDRFNIGLAISTSAKRPQAVERYRVEEMISDDADVIATGYQACYRELEEVSYQALTPEILLNFANPKTVAEQTTSYSRYYVLKDTERNRKILAGVGILDSYMLFDLKMISAPKIFHAANRFLKFVGTDGIVRTKEVKFAWFNPTYPEAGRILFEQIRYLEHAEGERIKLSGTFSENSKLAAMFGNLRFQPKVKSQLVLYPLPK